MEQQDVVTRVEALLKEIEVTLMVVQMYDCMNGSAPALKVQKNLTVVLTSLMNIQQNAQVIASTAPQCGLQK